uniref:HTH La-type RNA-binding domain-containing protein n=1 Tax=Timema monikensis TaxID=170555 RepID=A0A7R9EB86_9NEOP|nr:unnamed protein product [Timema monikensis]
MTPLFRQVPGSAQGHAANDAIRLTHVLKSVWAEVRGLCVWLCLETVGVLIPCLCVAVWDHRLIRTNENGTSQVQPTIVRATRDPRRFNQKASDFSDIDDWPTLGGAELANALVVLSPTAEDGETERRSQSVPALKQNGHLTKGTDKHDGASSSSSSSGGEKCDPQDDCTSSEENRGQHGVDFNDRRKKNLKQKWVPLDINLAKGRGKRDRSPKFNKERNEQGGEFNNRDENETNWRGLENDKGGLPHYYRNSRGGTAPRHRGRGGGRGGGRPIGRGGYRKSSSSHADSDYPDYPTEYSQVNKFNGSDTPTFMLPFMGTFYYDNSTYIRMDQPKLKETIRKQINMDIVCKRDKESCGHGNEVWEEHVSCYEEKQNEWCYQCEIVSCSEYYFSEENLNRDFFLRRKMDIGGYLPISLIASFNRVKGLSTDLHLIYESIKESDMLEVDETRVRTKDNPTKWPILEPTGPMPGPPIPGLVVASMLTHPVPAGFPIPLPLSFPHPFVPVVHPVEMLGAEMVEAEGAQPLVENLNPDVPEFVPVTVRLREENSAEPEGNEETSTITEGDVSENQENQPKQFLEPSTEVEIVQTESVFEEIKPSLVDPDVPKRTSPEVSEEISSSAGPPQSIGTSEDDIWQEVKRRVKPPPKDKAEEKRGKDHYEEREELDFQFDEELDVPVPSGRHNTFTDWSDEDSDYELSDHEINKILIVTQTSQSSRYPKHEGYDRTGDWTTRVKITQDLEHTINDGLNYYEDDLWLKQDWALARLDSIVRRSVVESYSDGRWVSFLFFLSKSQETRYDFRRINFHWMVNPLNYCCVRIR